MLKLTVQKTDQGEAVLASGPPFQALLTFLHPTTVVIRDGEKPWSVSKEEIISRTYDYARLHEVSSRINVGIEDSGTKYPALITFDGGIVIPALKRFSPIDQAAEFINDFVGTLLFGGLYCNAITAQDLSPGHLVSGPDRTYVRMHYSQRKSFTKLHHRMRIKTASQEDLLDFCGCRQIYAGVLEQVFQRGKQIRLAVPKVSPLYLLHGISAFVEHDWGKALASVWIAAEQLVSHLWSDKFLSGKASRTPTSEIPGRSQSLRDHRTWTASNQLEVLFQLGIISEETHRYLALARKSRNDLVHRAQTPDKQSVEAAYRGFIGLMTASLAEADRDALRLGLERYLRYIVPDPYDVQPSPPTFLKDIEGADDAWWYPIPGLPGEGKEAGEPSPDILRGQSADSHCRDAIKADEAPEPGPGEPGRDAP